MNVCSSCTNPAIAQGLCSKHYQERRRREQGSRSVRGPRPRYPQEVREKYQGAPHFTLRLEPELFSWAQERGGVAWMRQVLEDLRQGHAVAVEEAATGGGRAKSRATAFLEALHAAYTLKSGQPQGGLKKLLDLYGVLTLLPQASHGYSREAFGRDLYLLDRHPRLVRRGGQRFRLHPGATAARDRAKLIVVRIDGVEHTYYGIEFPPTAD